LYTLTALRFLKKSAQKAQRFLKKSAQKARKKPSAF